MLVKLRTKASVKSTQLLMLRGFRLFNHVRAEPWSMSRDVSYGNALVAVRYVDGCGVVDQPIFRLHGVGIFGRVSGEREPFGEGVISNTGAETRRTQLILLF